MELEVEANYDGPVILVAFTDRLEKNSCNNLVSSYVEDVISKLNHAPDEQGP